MYLSEEGLEVIERLIYWLFENIRVEFRSDPRALDVMDDRCVIIGNLVTNPLYSQTMVMAEAIYVYREALKGVILLSFITCRRPWNQ